MIWCEGWRCGRRKSEVRPQCLPISLSIKANVLKRTQEALSDVQRGLPTSCSLSCRHTGRPAAPQGLCQAPRKEGFSPPLHLACAWLPSVFTQIAPSRRGPSCHPFLILFNFSPSLSPPATTECSLLIYLCLLFVSSKKNNNS